MPFYTFILDFKGGTYVSQIDSICETTACQEWAKNLEIDEIADFGVKEKNALICSMNSAVPVRLQRLKNVWCISALIREDLAIVHFVETDVSNNGQRTTNN